MIKSISKEQVRTLRRRLTTLYGGEAEQLLERFLMMVGRYGIGGMEASANHASWSQKDAVLITYADGLQDSSRESPLQALHEFAKTHFQGALSTVHLLPFFPWSSDDGFSVIDYREVDATCGDWRQIEKLAGDFGLMFDLVLNHCSSRSSWFKDFVAGIQPARYYFLPIDPATDTSSVVRPRTNPLLTPTRTRDGEAHVWTTFSRDQVDLNWQNPDVLFEFLDILFFYLSKGMRVARLDAVAFLWKQIGTRCIHLPETHEIVKLFRDVCDVVAPETIILTETNVPHPENISYFGDGDEAHMVYQFSLPPLCLHALVTGNTTFLTEWAAHLSPPPPGCTFFNFTASHDGIGVRPVEGLLPADERDRLIRHVETKGGRVSWRSMPDGSKSPYELNITYYSALADETHPEKGVDRFLCSQALALSLRGIPGIYLHSLTATGNDLGGLEASGENRAINRYKWLLSDLTRHLMRDDASAIFHRYLKMLRKRAAHPAFHPDGEQHVFDIDPGLFVHSRISPDRDEVVFCIYNFTDSEKRIRNPGDTALLQATKSFHDILTGRSYGSGKRGFRLRAYQVLWLVPRG